MPQYEYANDVDDEVIVLLRPMRDADAPVEEKPVGKGIRRRGRMENHILETMATFGASDTVKIVDLVDRAVQTFPAPEPGERDTRRQRIVRAIQTLAKEKDGPLSVENNIVIFYE